jgi:hypothetical protein
MRSLVVVASVAWLSVGAGGCNQLTATTVAVSVLTSTPNLAQAENMDEGLANYLPLANLGLNQAVFDYVVVADKASATSTSLTPDTNAVVSISWDNTSVPLCSQANTPGAYAVSSMVSGGSSSCDTASFVYQNGATYSTNIQKASSNYTLQVTAPAPVSATYVNFTPTSTGGPLGTTSTVTLQMYSRTALASSGLTVDWHLATSAAGKNTFVTLARVLCTNLSNPLASQSWTVESNPVVYNNSPTQPADLIQLVLGPTPPTQVTIPGSAFNTTGLYLLILTTADLSTNVSDNLAIGSAALAGAGTAWVFWVS